MKFLQDIIKNPTEQKYLENDSYFTDYSDDCDDEDFWGYGMICQNLSSQSDIDVEVKYDEDKDAFLTFVIFNTDQIYDDNKNFFNKSLKDMGFHRTKQKEWVEFKQYIIKENYWYEMILKDVGIENQIQEVAIAITKELFMRMIKAGIKPGKKEEENMDNPKLTEEEKRQLEKELRPIKDVVKCLYRYQYSDRDCGVECFNVILINDFVVKNAFCGTANRAYMRVERDRYYTLEELGLFKEEE